jgi:Ca-activated chloride channel family protein
MKRFLARLVCVVGLVAGVSLQAQVFIVDRPARPPHSHGWAEVGITSTRIQAKIRDAVAMTTVEEQIYNPNSQPMEGTFLFPVPRGAQLDKFTMDIDGRPVEAEMLKAEKARGIYEDIVRRMKDPALLEYAGRDLFKVHVFPIDPHGKRRLVFSFTEVLKTDSGLVRYAFPLNTEKYSAKPLKNVSVQVDLETTQPLKSIYSSSHSVEIKREGNRRARIGYEASNTQPDNDYELFFMPEASEVGATLMTYRNGGEDGFFLLLASPGVDVKEERIIPKDVVFVLDTSGSMAGKKLTQAKKALEFCVENLNESDRFELVRFSTDVDPVFGRLTAVSEASRRQAGDKLKLFKPIGSTAIDAAMKAALALRPEKADRPFVVIFLTDGLPTVGETDNERIIAAVKEKSGGHARVFCFGIGTDVNTHLLDSIAGETGAHSQYVLPEEDIETKVSNFYAKIKDPVLSHPRLVFPVKDTSAAVAGCIQGGSTGDRWPLQGGWQGARHPGGNGQWKEVDAYFPGAFRGCGQHT